jgi:hypothetical protein
MTTISLEVLDKRRVISLIEAALQREVSHLEMGILKTQRRIETLEQKYDCKLEEIDETIGQCLEVSLKPCSMMNAPRLKGLSGS